MKLLIAIAACILIAAFLVVLELCRDRDDQAQHRGSADRGRLPPQDGF